MQFVIPTHLADYFYYVSPSATGLVAQQSYFGLKESDIDLKVIASAYRGLERRSKHTRNDCLRSCIDCKKPRVYESWVKVTIDDESGVNVFTICEDCSKLPAYSKCTVTVTDGCVKMVTSIY